MTKEEIQYMLDFDKYLKATVVHNTEEMIKKIKANKKIIIFDETRSIPIK